MTWEMDSNRYIFLQIIEKIKVNIAARVYAPGDKLPSVRELAKEASVNQNTVQKALSELEGMELVHSHSTKGRFVTEENSVIYQLKKEIVKIYLKNFVNE